MSNSNAKFLTGAPMRHVAVMSATASIGLMAMFVVDFVDMIFISMLGNAALAAAIGYAGSILFFTTSFGIGIAIAAGAWLHGHWDQVMKCLLDQGVTCIDLWRGFGAIFAAAVWFNVLNLVTLVGASGKRRNWRPHTCDYHSKPANFGCQYCCQRGFTFAWRGVLVYVCHDLGGRCECNP